MRLLHFLLLCLLLPVVTVAHADETRAEHAASVYAQHEIDTTPRHANLTDYSLPEDKLEKAVTLDTVHNTMHFVEELWSLLSLILLLAFGYVAFFRDTAQKLGEKAFLQKLVLPYELFVFAILIDIVPMLFCWLARGNKIALGVGILICFMAPIPIIIWNWHWMRCQTYRWVEGFTFVVIFDLTLTVLSLPLDLYAHRLSLRYGLSVQSWISWFGDMGKTFAFGVLGLDLVIMLLMWIIKVFPRSWWFVSWVVSIPAVFFLVFAAPYGNSLYNKFEPLQKTNPALVAQLETIVAKGHMDIPPERMFLMKASEKTTQLNAYVTGFGSSKRVVVWDTSLQKGTTDEVLFIFGHESGHYVLNHIVYGVTFSIVGLLVLMYLGYHFVQWALRRFGPYWKVTSQNDWGAFAVLVLAFSLFGLAAEPIQNYVSRMDEHAADVYGQEAVHGLIADPQATAKAAFQVLGENSLVDPNPNPFIESWTYSHPAIGRRAAFAAAYDPWEEGLEPKYFKK